MGGLICLECSLSQNCQHVYTSRHNSNDTTRPIGTQGAAYRPYECADTDDTPPPWMSAATHPTSTSVWGGARMDLPDAITNSEVTMQPRWQSPASPRRSTPSRVNETPVRCSYLMQVSCAACAGSTTTRARQHTCACEHSLLSISTRSNRPATRKVAQKNRKKAEKSFPRIFGSPPPQQQASSQETNRRHTSQGSYAIPGQTRHDTSIMAEILR